MSEDVNAEQTGPANAEEGTLPELIGRGAVGGSLMGLANLVPGISGGTMLLATGVYPGFISAIAELTTLKFKKRSLILLGSIVCMAAAAILFLAGPTKTLVVEQRWVMYSIFIGLTLGGVPLVWRLAKPASAGVIGGAIFGFAVMVAMALVPSAGASGGEHQYFLLFLAGLSGAAAMILPGVSGGYLLLLLGQYVPILSAVDKLKQGLVGSGGPNIDLIIESMHVVIPVGLGVVAGVVGVSNLLKWLLEKFPKPTLGALLGLLVGAVVGLWPFQEGVKPQVGDTYKGQVLTAEKIEKIKPEKYPLARFDPSGMQVGVSILLILGGLGTTIMIDRFGSGKKEAAKASVNA